MRIHLTSGHEELTRHELPRNVLVDVLDRRQPLGSAALPTEWIVTACESIEQFARLRVGRCVVRWLAGQRTIFMPRSNYESVEERDWEEWLGVHCWDGDAESRIYLHTSHSQHRHRWHPLVTTVAHEFGHAVRAALRTTTDTQPVYSYDCRTGWPNAEEYFAVVIENMARDELDLPLFLGYGAHKLRVTVTPPGASHARPRDWNRPSDPTSDQWHGAFPPELSARSLEHRSMSYYHAQPEMQGLCEELARVRNVTYNPFRWFRAGEYGYLRPLRDGRPL